MSLIDIPQEVTIHMLSFLDWTDIWLLFQPVCKEWYNIAANAPIIVHTTWDKLFGAPLTTFQYLKSRLPQLRQIQIQKSSDNKKHEDHQIAFCNQWDICPVFDSSEFKEVVLSLFPNYCAINASILAQHNSTKKILADISDMHITHVLFDRSIANTPQLSAIIDHVLPTITHLYIYEPNFGPIWNLFLKRVEKYNGVLQIQHISNPSLAERDYIISGFEQNRQWEKIFERTPKLQSYFGLLSRDAGISMVTHCPHVQKLDLLYDVNLDFLLDNLPIRVLHLQSLYLYKAPARLKSFVKLEELIMPSSCSEVDVNAALVDCPTLRYIYGVNDFAGIPRFKDGAIDARK